MKSEFESKQQKDPHAPPELVRTDHINSLFMTRETVETVETDDFLKLPTYFLVFLISFFGIRWKHELKMITCRSEDHVYLQQCCRKMYYRYTSSLPAKQDDRNSQVAFRKASKDDLRVSC